MESVDPDATASTIPHPNNTATTCDVRRWFDEEAALSIGEFECEWVPK